MQNFLLKGVTESEKSGLLMNYMHIQLPKAKHFEPEKLYYWEHKEKYIESMASATSKSRLNYVNENLSYIPQTTHSYPLAQGPLNLPIETELVGGAPSAQEVLTARTTFIHENSQICCEWKPIRTGISAWGAVAPDPKFLSNERHLTSHVAEKLEIENSIQGAASSLEMKVIYPCNINSCRIYCPCNICNDARKTCKLICKEYPCKNCNSQCNKHELKIPRSFDAENDSFTIISHKLNKYIHIIPHAGIPRSCRNCTHDVHEHQILHLVYHIRCRFCRHEMKLFCDEMIIQAVDDFQNSRQIDTIIDDFRRAESKQRLREDRTCSFCLKIFLTKYIRERHEMSIHLKKRNTKFSCDHCDKSYMSSNDLSNHSEEVHNDSKIECNICKMQLSSERRLSQHKKDVHEKKDKVKCDECNLKFSKRCNMLRHMKEKHLYNKLNLDFAEDFGKFLFYSCNECDQTFKRKGNLTRHVETVHKKLAEETDPIVKNFQ